jgi:hypothetical protein
LDFLLILHSLVRWPILVVALVGLALSLWERGWEGGPPRWRSVLAPLYLGLLDLQFLAGLVLGLLDRERFAEVAFHAVVMGAAVVIAHVLRVRAKRFAEERRARAEALLFGISLVFILVGLSLIPA